MKSSFRFFPLLSFLILFALPGIGQQLLWKKDLDKGHYGFSLDIRDICRGSNGRLYSTGSFLGPSQKFGDLTIYADTDLVDLPTNVEAHSVYYETAFLACQNANGEYLWVRKIGGNKAFSFSNPDWNRFRGIKISSGADGSICLVAMVKGEHLFFNGQALANQPQEDPANPFHLYAAPARHLLVLKTDPDGNLAWARPFHIGKGNLSGYMENVPNVLPRFLEFGSQGLELMVSYVGELRLGTQNLPDYGEALLRFSEAGEVTSSVRQAHSNPVSFNLGYSTNTLTKRLSDGRWVLGYSSASPYPGQIGTVSDPFSYFDIFNPAFTTRLSRTAIRFLTPPTAQPKLCLPQDFWILPDGKLALEAYIAIGDDSPTQLILNSDTLQLPNLNSGSADSWQNRIFVKLDNNQCIKQVETFRDPAFSFGSRISTPGGHQIGILGPSNSSSQTLEEGKIFFVSRNFENTLALPIGQAGKAEFPSHMDFATGVSFQNFQIRLSADNSFGWFCTAGTVGMFSVPQSFPPDESAAGCLRGNAITSARDVQKQDLFLSQSQNGVEIRATDNQSGRYRILGSDGRLLEEGSWKGSQTPIGRSIRTKGVYQVVLNGKSIQKTLRFVQ